MIVKSKSYKRIGAARGLLEYAFNDESRLYDSTGRSFVISHNFKGNSINEWVAEIKENEKLRKHKRSNNNRLTQEIISFHPRDAKHITIRMLEQVAREYIRRRNPNGMYIAVPHFDKGHYHIHIIAAAVEYKTGKSLRMSRQAFSELKRGIQEWQVEKFPALISIVRHGRKRKAPVTDREYQYKKRTGKETKREEIHELVQSCYKEALTLDDFFARLKAKGVEPYLRGKSTTGIVADGKKYRLKKLGFDMSRFGIAVKERKSKALSATREPRTRRSRTINSKSRRIHDR